MQLRKIIIAPDSFKGSLTSRQVADIIASEIASALPGCEIVSMPIADGGEGSVETILSALGGEMHTAKVRSPDDREISAGYGIAQDGTAIIEMAQSSGITKQNGLHPMTSTTYGFGQLIVDALERGAMEFMLCIGGSATTDGGCGMAAALGAVFLDENGKEFVPSGGTLLNITSIDTGGLDKRISESRFTVMCDVTNPLYGPSGAAFVYSPQKGASPEQVILLDEGLRHLGSVFMETFSKDFANTPGAGAAGGLGAGCLVFLDASLKSGIDAILELCGFKRHLDNTDLIITGEGKLDLQSFNGKVLSGILSDAGNVPVWSICGINECDAELLRKFGVSVFETCDGFSAEESMRDPEKCLRIAVRRMLESV